MGILDLSSVTRALIKLIESAYNHSDVKNLENPAFSAEPPDQISADGISLYLYHISENQYFKNLTAQGDQSVPIRYTPMALNLFYILTAHATSGAGTITDAEREQQAMGVAVKALHDYPIINEQTVVNGTTLFELNLVGTNTELKIELQNVLPNESSNYWAAGSASPRLAAYYTVSVIMLEPEELMSSALRVLSYGTTEFKDLPPKIDNSESTLTVKPPGYDQSRKIKLQPAQAPPAPDSVSDTNYNPEVQEILFRGTGFVDPQLQLLLKCNRWEEPKAINPAYWQLRNTEKEVTILVRERISKDEEASVILPGLYSAVIQTEKQTTTSDGDINTVNQVSNECVFAVTPLIKSVDEDANGQVKIVVNILTYEVADPPADPDPNDDPYLNEYPELTDIQIYIGRDKYQKVGENLDAGQFIVTIDKDITVTFKAKDEIVSGLYYQLRVVINGAASHPTWFKAP